MKLHLSLLVSAMVAACLPAEAAPMAPDMKAKVEAKLKDLESWGKDPEVVAAVKAYNAAPAAEAKAMTNEKWKTLTVLDPFVRSLSKNGAAQALKAKRDDSIAEAFVSAADGNKVAFLSKPTFWCHQDKDKHRLPMTGKTWIGPLEMDESSGQLSVQVAFPVLDGTKPIGSIVIGLSASKLK